MLRIGRRMRIEYVDHHPLAQPRCAEGGACGNAEVSLAAGQVKRSDIARCSDRSGERDLICKFDREPVAILHDVVAGVWRRVEYDATVIRMISAAHQDGVRDGRCRLRCHWRCGTVCLWAFRKGRRRHREPDRQECCLRDGRRPA
jgi:hypothetical protein